MLIGSYEHILDTKKRLSIPSKWRVVLGEKIIVTTGLDKSLFIFSSSKWETIAKEIAEKGFYSADSRNFARFILSNAFELSIDSHGRVLLPDSLVDFASLSQEVVLSGVYDRAEIWDKKEFTKVMQNVNKDAENTALRISTN
ncbi:MAG: transcriptional regulator MraZ [Patescibacteria group bacterium]|nr:transcriptional regulator MraZ [Patescibacteria group bacterium]